MAVFLALLWMFGSIFLICYAVVDESWLLGIIGTVSIIAFISLAVTSNINYINDFDAKCQAAGGQTLEYRAYRHSTQLTCVKKDSVINVQ